MKILAIGDPHFQTENIVEVNMFLEKIETLAKKENPNFIVILGDVLHTHERLHTIPLNKAYEFVKKMKQIAFTYVLVGNHDYIQNQQFLTTNHWMNGMKEWTNVCIVDKTEILSFENKKIVFVPYVPPGRFLEALETESWKNCDCIFAHQEFFGCKMGAIISTEGDKWDENFPFVVSGHIHNKQSPQKNIYYCGSSMQHAFGESEKNIIPIIEFEDEIKIREIDLELPRKKIIYTDIENISDVKISNSQDKIKITVSGNYEEFKAFKKTKKYKEILNTGTKVVFKPKKIEIKDNDEFNTVKEKDFFTILNDLIKKQENNLVFEVFEKVVNGKEIQIILEDDNFSN